MIEPKKGFAIVKKVKPQFDPLFIFTKQLAEEVVLGDDEKLVKCIIVEDTEQITSNLKFNKRRK